MKCKECGGPCELLPDVRSFFDIPTDRPTCVYAKWLRNGVFEDGGICIGKRDDRD